MNSGVLYVQEEGYEEIRGEIEMLQQCSNPNVVRYLGSYQGEEYLWVGAMDFIAYLNPICERSNAFGSVILLFYFLTCLELMIILCSDCYENLYLLTDSNGVLWRWKCCRLDEHH